MKYSAFSRFQQVGRFLFATIVAIISCLHASAQMTRPIFDVRNYGAVGDGKTNDQKAIQKAVDQCKKRGGTVLLQKGTFLTGQISLVGNMTLYIDSSATVLGVQSDSESDYPHHMIETVYQNRMKDDCQRRLIYGNKVQNVTITGGGTINGQGDYSPWMNVKELGTEKDRPSIFAFVGAKDIAVSNLTLLKPACWTQVYIESDRVTLKNLRINTGSLTPNRDGIDIVDCHQVIIEDCQIKAEDDGICFKSGSEYGCNGAIVRRCTIDKLNVKAGNCFKLGTDGLGSFTDFLVSDLTLMNAYQNSAIAIESVDGAMIDNLNFSNCTINNCGQAIFVLLGNRGRTVPGRQARIGTISNLHFKNIKGDGFTQSYPSIITGIKGHNIQNVTLDDVVLNVKGGVSTNDQVVMEYDGKYPEGSKYGDTNAAGIFIRHVDSAVLTNCQITTVQPDARALIVKEDVQELITK